MGVLVGVIGGLTAVTIAFFVVTLKLTVAGGPDYLQAFTGVYKTFVSVCLVYLVLDQGVISGIVRWLTSVWNMVPQFL